MLSTLAKLRVLDVKGTGITTNGAAELRKNLPKPRSSTKRGSASSSGSPSDTYRPLHQNVIREREMKIAHCTGHFGVHPGR